MIERDRSLNEADEALGAEGKVDTHALAEWMASQLGNPLIPEGASVFFSLAVSQHWTSCAARRVEGCSRYGHRMTYQATVVRVLMASPGDTVAERRLLQEAIADWNSVHGDQEVLLQPLMWERDATPELADRAQGVINRQLVDNADMLIGIFWTRLGTPTSEADSGTVEEIERVAAAGKPVLLYFSQKPVVPESVDLEQYALVRQAQERFMAQGLVDQFESEDEFYRKVTAAMTRTVRSKFVAADVPESLGDDEVLSVSHHRPVGAQLIASLDRFSQQARFVVENRGDATAENVIIEVEAADDGSKPTIFLPDAPIRSLPPGGAVDFATAIGFGSSTVWDVVFRWTDPQGEREARQTVTF